MRISDWSSDVCSSDLQPSQSPAKPNISARSCGPIAKGCFVGMLYVPPTAYSAVANAIMWKLLTDGDVVPRSSMTSSVSGTGRLRDNDSHKAGGSWTQLYGCAET